MRRRWLGTVVIAFLVLMFLNVTVFPSRISKNALLISDVVSAVGALTFFLVFNHINKWNDELKPSVYIEALILVLIALFITFSRLSSQYDSERYRRMRTISGVLSGITILIPFVYYSTLWTNKEILSEEIFSTE